MTTAAAPPPFAQTLRRLRLAAGYDTLAELAHRAGLTPQGLSKMELGQSHPSWSTVQKLAQALGLSTEEFRDR